MTNAELVGLGLLPRSAHTPVPPPTSAPVINIQSVRGNTVSLRLREGGDSTRRGKPVGVSGAAVYRFASAPSADRRAGLDLRGVDVAVKLDVLPEQHPAGVAGLVHRVLVQPAQAAWPGRDPRHHEPAGRHGDGGVSGVFLLLDTGLHLQLPTGNRRPSRARPFAEGARQGDLRRRRSALRALCADDEGGRLHGERAGGRPDRCGDLFLVVAVGARGDRATIKLQLPDCPPAP